MKDTTNNDALLRIYKAIPPAKDPEGAGVKWIKDRPPELWPVLAAFPPMCVVKGKKTFRFAPLPGQYGVVTRYLEPSLDSPSGQCGVMNLTDVVGKNDNAFAAYCDASDLELVDCYDWTPERIRALFLS